MEEQKRTPKYSQRTIQSLRLDVKAAIEGRTWLLLPDGFRDQDSGSVYPLPSKVDELQLLTTIPIPPSKHDSGCLYIRRAIKKWRERASKKQSAVLDIQSRRQEVHEAHWKYDKDMKRLREEAREAVDKVKEEASQAIANLADLFALGRKGIEGQMKAHLDGTKWQNEEISSRAFRECFRMVTQAVKGLGLPSEQRDVAAQAVVEELAASLKATKEVLKMAPGRIPEETEH